MSEDAGYVRQIPRTCPGHSRPVTYFKYSAVTKDGIFLISACKDGKPMLRDGVTGDWIGTFEGHKGAVFGVDINDEATIAATGSADFSAKLWNSTTGDEVQNFPHKHVVNAVAISQDSSWLATGGREKKIRIFDLSKCGTEDGGEPVKVLEGHTAGVRVLLWQDADTIISGGSDNTLRIWSVKEGKNTKNIELGGEINSAEFSRNRTLLTVTSGKEVVFFNATTFDVVKRFTLDDNVSSASLHTTEPRFVVGLEKSLWVHVHDYETGKEIECHKGHHGPVHCVRFSPNFESYSSGSEDGTVRIWQTFPKVAEKPAEAPAN